MAEFFTEKYHLAWAVLLALALFFPVRRLIWTLALRRVQRRTGEVADMETQRRLMRRAGVSAALLCFVVGYLYTSTWWAP